MTGAGMMDCKKALTATEGDMDKAVEFLKKKVLLQLQRKLDVSQQKVSFAKQLYEDEKESSNCRS